VPAHTSTGRVRSSGVNPHGRTHARYSSTAPGSWRVASLDILANASKPLSRITAPSAGPSVRAARRP